MGPATRTTDGEGETVRLGLVGLGGIGRYHATQLRALAVDGAVELVGGMDVDGGARDRFGMESA